MKSKKSSHHQDTKQTHKKITIKKIENGGKKKRGCSCDVKQTRLKNENVAKVVKPIGSCNANFYCTFRCEIKKKKTQKTIYCSWSCKFSSYNCHHGVDFV